NKPQPACDRRKSTAPLNRIEDLDAEAHLVVLADKRHHETFFGWKENRETCPLSVNRPLTGNVDILHLHVVGEQRVLDGPQNLMMIHKAVIFRDHTHRNRLLSLE